MTNIIANIFATHHQNCAIAQALLNILLTTDERQLVINRNNEEAQHLHKENSDGIPTQLGQFP